MARPILASYIALSLAACATPLTSNQKAELEVYRTKGWEVTEKDPAVGGALGVLPGGGSFYNGDYALGAVNFLLWPVSTMWEPINGRRAAEALNYRATVANVNNRRAAELKPFNDQLAGQTITPEQYEQQRQRIERKYAPEIE